jgi:hypothetical protein
MDYLTKWPEAKPTKKATAETTVQFIYEDIICRHGYPRKILTDRGSHFNNKLLKLLTQKFSVEHILSTPYHSQTNGLVERFNRTLGESLARMSSQHPDQWDEYIAPALFAYRTSKHSTTRVTPFYLVYGREAKLPTDQTEVESELTIIDHMATRINDLPIVRNQVKFQIEEEQQKQKDRHDKRLPKQHPLRIGDKVLYYKAILDQRRSGKLDPKWKGPYYIHQIIGNGAYKLRELDGRMLQIPANGSLLKIYKDPFSLDY